VGVIDDPLQRLTGLVGEDLVQAAAHLEDLLGLDLHVGRGAPGAAGGLVQEEAGVGEGVAPLLRHRHVDQRAGAGHPAGAHHPDGGGDEADHVVDGVAGLHVPALGVDEDGDGSSDSASSASSWPMTSDASFWFTSPLMISVRALNRRFRMLSVHRLDVGRGVASSSSSCGSLGSAG
jgi:hypothetical protein